MLCIVMALTSLTLGACENGRQYAAAPERPQETVYDTHLFRSDRVIGTQSHFEPRLAESLQNGFLLPANTSFEDMMVATLAVKLTPDSGASVAEIDVTTLSPRILNSVHSNLQDVSVTAISAVRFTDDGRELVFFSRSPQTLQGFRSIIPLSKLTDKPIFEFPVIIDGRLQPVTFEVVEVLKRGPLPDRLAPFKVDGWKGKIGSANDWLLSEASDR